MTLARIIAIAVLTHMVFVAARMTASLYALAATTLVAGVAASTALPTLLASSPLVAGLLVLGAHRAVQRPLLTARARRSALPPALDQRIAETLSGLPLGTARSLLADLARLGDGLHRASGAPLAVGAELDELLSRACDAAHDLAGLDETLAVLEKQRETAHGVAAWAAGHAAVERARDRLVQQLLDALTVVSRLQGRALESTETAGDQLSALARELAERGEADAAAMREVEAILK